MSKYDKILLIWTAVVCGLIIALEWAFDLFTPGNFHIIVPAVSTAFLVGIWIGMAMVLWVKGLHKL